MKNNSDKPKTAKAPKLKSKSSSKAPKRSLFKRGNKSMSTYSSLVYRKKVKKEKQARKRAEDLATLPKNPVKRFLMHFHPKRVFKYWFSKRGLKTFLKIVAAVVLIFIILVFQERFGCYPARRIESF